MCLNKITLISFLGGDAEKKVNNATNIAVFPGRDRTSVRNDAGTWESRTEWRRCVAFEKLAGFAGTLAKGANVAVEDELRSHEYRPVAIGVQKTSIV
jgi:single-strand DNA-binding protein